MANTIHANGRPVRKTLAEQLDRLDGIIGTLSDGLNQMVADVVKEAVTLAVQQALEGVMQAVLTNPGLLRQLTAQVNPPVPNAPEPKPARPSRLKLAWQWLRTKASIIGTSIKDKVRRFASGIGTKLRGAREKARGFFPGLREMARKVWKLRRPVVLSSVIGLVVCGIGAITGPVISTVLLGVSASALSLTGYVVLPFVRLMRAMQVES